MAVVIAIILYVVMYPIIALAICVGAVYLVSPKKPKAPRPAPARNRSGPPPAASKPPAPAYLRRWNQARRVQSFDEKTRWQTAFNNLAGPNG